MILLQYCWSQTFEEVLLLMWKSHEILEIPEGRFQVLSLPQVSSPDFKEAWLKLSCWLKQKNIEHADEGILSRIPYIKNTLNE